MEKKIVTSLFYMGIITATAGILITTAYYYFFFHRETEQNLVHECRLVAQCYDKLNSVSELERFTEESFRITLIKSDGTVLFESDAEAESMENHLDRPEIAAAIKNGSGSDTRYSDTLGAEDYYYAMRLGDGNILRVSIQADSIIALFERSLVIILIIIICIVAVSMFVSVKLTDKLISPLKRIPQLLENSQPTEESCVYPEIAPLIEEIRSVRSSQEKMRQEFTANVSHELKTPLTSISGYAELIESGMAEGAVAARFAGKIKSESERMLSLIGDILRLSELDASGCIPLNDEIELSSIAYECAGLLEHSAKQRGIEITVKGRSDIFMGNRTEIHELIYNLTDNAIKYNRENGSVQILISGTSISVSDTGIGIPKDSLPRIFERFYRADKSRSRAKGGTGLGLSIVRHIAEHHGAKITADSIVNVGTEITVEFPPAKHTQNPA